MRVILRRRSRSRVAEGLVSAGTLTDQRLWRIVEHYVSKAVERLDITRVKAIGLDGTAAKRGQTYVTVFIDLDRNNQPIVFVSACTGGAASCAFLCRPTVSTESQGTAGPLSSATAPRR